MHKLLLADDSVTIQRVIELTFSGEDVQVVTVGDGEEAIARIPTERPDIVLADIGMPKRSGYDVAAFVKGHPELAHIPVLLLAGAFEPVDQARAEEVKCDGVLVKPFEPQQVIARVRELIEGAKGSPMRATAGVPRAIDRLGGGAGNRDAGTQIRDSRTEVRTAKADSGGMPDSRVASPAASVTNAELRSAAVREAAISDDDLGIPHVEEGRLLTPEPRVPNPESRLANAGKPGGVPAGTNDSLDAYFDRLDAAFASLATPGEATVAPESLVLDDLTTHVDVPTIDDLLGGVPVRTPPGGMPAPGAAIAGPPVEPPDGTPTMTPSPRAPEDHPREHEASSEGRSVIADVFSALLAVEQGDEGATLRLSRAQSKPVITDELVDEVTRRVLERLAPAAAKDVVARIVSEVAERLVREEIARIRNKA